jgi:uncharacterized protein (TIGR02246 family)
MRKTSWIAAIAIVATSLAVGAQKADPDSQKIADQYIAAFNKGDAKGIAALYTANAARLGPDGMLIAGRAAIEKSYADGFAGPLKGGKLTLQMGATHLVAPNVKVMEGRFTVAATIPINGRFINTAVKQGAGWLLASVVTMPDPPAAK